MKRASPDSMKKSTSKLIVVKGKNIGQKVATFLFPDRIVNVTINFPKK